MSTNSNVSSLVYMATIKISRSENDDCSALSMGTGRGHGHDILICSGLHDVGSSTVQKSM